MFDCHSCINSNECKFYTCHFWIHHCDCSLSLALANLPIMLLSEARLEADAPVYTSNTAMSLHYKKSTVSCTHNARLAHLSIKWCWGQRNRVQCSLVAVPLCVCVCVCVCVSTWDLLLKRSRGDREVKKESYWISGTKEEERPSRDQG